MLFKWMVCQVTDSRRDSFSRAQQQWSSIASAPGFLSQLGGWDHKHPGDACIMGIWEDQCSYHNFMDNIHDTITEKSQQEQTYEKLTVCFYHDVMPIPGNAETSEEALHRSGWVRIAECLVKPDRIEHFTQTQKQLWNPGMAQVTGMLGGYFCRDNYQEHRYLVMSFWQDRASHQDYLEHYFPTLREQAGVEEDVEGLVGRFIELETEWKVNTKGYRGRSRQ